ncbi:RNA polymerase sigma-70 factor [Prolixibacteraceae bacterium JC049]|nr:RNA polymerase sigma-70 factor [Prolixibacteraceae bacterium JC049]
MTEKQLIDNIKSGREEAFKQLFDTYYLQLTIYANKYVSDLDQSRELVQDLFVRLYEKRNKLDIHTSLKAHLYQSVRNSCINLIKQKQMQSGHHDNIKYLNSGNDMDTTDKVLESELEHHIFQALDFLPEQCRKIFEMNRFSGLKNQEIADKLDISKRTVETQISKALKILRSKLSNYLNVILLFLFTFFNN